MDLNNVFKYLNEYIQVLENEKNDLSNNEFFVDGYDEKIINIKNEINMLCNHNWYEDEIDDNNGEGTLKISYCSNCNLCR